MFDCIIIKHFRCNGIRSPPNDQISSSKSFLNVSYTKSKLSNRELYNNVPRRDRKYVKAPISYYHNNDSSDVKVKLEPEDLDYNDKLTAHSIIGKFIFQVSTYEVKLLSVGLKIIKSYFHVCFIVWVHWQHITKIISKHVNTTKKMFKM